MNTGTRNILIAAGVGLLVGIGVGVVIARPPKKKCGCQDHNSEEEQLDESHDQFTEADIPAEQTKTKAPAVPKGNDDFPLELGSEGQRVERLQVFLMRHFGGTGKLSGVYDETTAQKVKKYLKRNNIDKTTYERLQMDKMVHDQRVDQKTVRNA